MAYVGPPREQYGFVTRGMPARPVPLTEKGAPISAPGSAEGGMVWWTTLLSHLILWLICGPVPARCRCSILAS